MRLTHVRPHSVRRLNRKIRVDIAVLVLGRTVQRDDLVHRLLKLGVFARCERVRRRFDPLRDVAVLEHHAVEFLGLDVAALELLRRKADILNRVAFFHLRQRVVQNFILIRQHLVAHQLLYAPDKAVVRMERLN